MSRLFLASLATLAAGVAVLAAHQHYRRQVQGANRILPAARTGHTEFLVVHGRKYHVTPAGQQFGRWGWVAGAVLALAGTIGASVPAASAWRARRARDRDPHDPG